MITTASININCFTAKDRHLVFTEIKPANFFCQYYNNNRADSVISVYKKPVSNMLQIRSHQKISNVKGNEY